MVRCFKPVLSRVNAPDLVATDMPMGPLFIVAPARIELARSPGFPLFMLKLSEMALSASSLATRGLIPFDFRVVSNASIPSETSSLASWSFFSATLLNF